MRPKPGILSIMLVLTLAVTTVALSGHLASHKPTASGYCSLCIHAEQSAGAIVYESSRLADFSPANIPDPLHTAGPVLAANLNDHPSRAPPTVN